LTGFRAWPHHERDHHRRDVTDVQMPERIHQDLDRGSLLSTKHLVDAGYTSAELFINPRRDFNITLTGPLQPDNSPGSGREGFERPRSPSTGTATASPARKA
jgi:hypothetical protein